MTSRGERKRQCDAEDSEHGEKGLEHDRPCARSSREEINAQLRRKRKSDPVFREWDRARCARKWRKIRYGLTTEDYRRMLMQQQGVCKICKRKSRATLCVDHSHATGKVRGLLCHRCNTGLGLYDDDPRRLHEAAAYVDTSGDLPESRFLLRAMPLACLARAVATRLWSRAKQIFDPKASSA